MLRISSEHIVVLNRKANWMKRDHEVVQLGTRAVDVGYFNTKYSCGRNPEGSNDTIRTGLFLSLAPTLASLDAVVDPGSKKLRGCTVEVDGAHYFVGHDAHYKSRNSDLRTVSSEYCMSGQYLALLRGAMSDMADRAGGGQEFTITDLVVGLPLSTFQQHRNALKSRCEGEHIMTTAEGHSRRVTVQRAHVVVQPFGALLNFGLSRQGKLEGLHLVVDVGGGTLDWYITDREKANWARSGAYAKAMLACSYSVADRLNESWKDQIKVMARIDKAIQDGAPSFEVAGRTYALAPFQGVIEAVLEECLLKMLSKIGHTDDIDHILLTGGGAPVFRRYFAKRKPQLAELMVLDKNPVFSNVRGFHAFGELHHATKATA